MRKRVGLLGALSTIAVGVSLSTVGSVSAQQAALPPPGSDLAVLCRAILDTTTVNEFQSLSVAVDAFNNPSDPCHEVAQAQWILLSSPEAATGAIETGGAGGGGAGGGGAGGEVGSPGSLAGTASGPAGYAFQ